MNPGKLNRKLQILDPSQKSDGSGGYEDVLVPVKTVWANIKPVSGREFYQAQQAKVEISHKVTIRYTTDIKRSHLLSFGNKNYDIQYFINLDEESRFLEIQVLERQ